MTAYPETENERRIPVGMLLELVGAIFQRCGMNQVDAHLLADSLVTSDAQGVHSHGVIRVPEYAKKMVDGGVDPNGIPWVVSQTASALVVDGGNSMGQIGTAFAMDKAIATARTQGVAAVAIRGSNHNGALGYFARMALAHDMIAMVTTNALPTMAPWGGTEKIVGMNPMAIAIPAGTECPIVFDAAFAASSHGKLRVYSQKGAPIPEGWAFDPQGRPTTDPAQAVLGLLQPIGGHKGIALAMAMGVLATLLSGASYGTELGNMIDGPKAGEDGHFVLVLNIAAFVDPSTFKERVDRIVRQVHQSPRAAGIERLLVPGEQERETELAYRKAGIPLNEETLAGVRKAAERAAVNASVLK
jgi:LDH2 family malate/lactate/ureidoglycolate dehydrogenase